MTRNIKINCKKVYETGIYYEQKSADLKKMQEELRAIVSNIESKWSGNDRDVFVVKVNNSIEELSKVTNFLDEKGRLLKSKALDHGAADNKFLLRMERSNFDEK